MTAATDLAAAETAVERARTELEEASADVARVEVEFYADPENDALWKKVAKARDKRDRIELTLRAHEQRAQNRRGEVEQARRDELAKRYAALKSKIATSAWLDEIAEDVRAIAQIETVIAQRVEQVRAVCARQRERFEEAERLATELGDQWFATQFAPANLDDARLATAIVIYRARAKAGRKTPVAEFVASAPRPAWTEDTARYDALVVELQEVGLIEKEITSHEHAAAKA